MGIYISFERNFTIMAHTHYPPSKLRYMARNPCITFNVSAEMKKKIEELCRVEGLSKAQLVKNFFFDITKAFDDLKQAHIKEIDDLKTRHAIELEEAKKLAYTHEYRKGIADVENEKLKWIRGGYNLRTLGVQPHDLESFINTL